MAGIGDEARIPVYINDEQARSAIKNLTIEAEKWRKTMVEAMAGGDMKGMADARAEMTRLEKDAAKLKRTSIDVDSVLRNLSTTGPRDLRKALRELGNEQDRNVLSSKAYQERVRLLQTELHSINGTITQQTGFMGRLGGAFNNIPGPAGSAIDSIKSMGKAMWALVANPIGLTIAAIVGGLTLLYKAFTSTDSGAVAMEGALKAIGNVMDVLIDRAMSYYKMLYSLVTFDWEGVKKNAKDAFGGIGTAIKDAASAGWEYSKTMDDIADREVAAANRMVTLRNDIELLKNKAQRASGKERLAMLKEAMAKEIELNGIETGFLAERNAAETSNLASKIQNDKLSMAQKEEMLKKWLAIDDTQLASAMANDAAFAEFANKNEEEFQKLQKTKADQLGKQADLQTGTRRLQNKLATEEKEELTAGAKAYEEATKKKLELTDASNKKEVSAINKRHLEGKTSEDQYDAELLTQDFKYLQEKRDIYKVGSKEYEDASAAFLERQVKAQEQVKTLLLQAEKELSDAKIENLKDGIEKEKAIEDQRWKDELKQLKEKLIIKESLSKEEVAINDAINQTIVEKTSAHIKTTTDLNTAAALQKQMDTALIDEAKSITDAEKWAAAREIAQAQYQQDIDDAKGNATAMTQAQRNLSNELIAIKQDEQARKNEINMAVVDSAYNMFGALVELVGKETALGKALFLFQQAAAIGQIIFNTAIANSKALAMYPGPVGIALTVMNTISAAAGIASVIGQTFKEFTGGESKSEGGYTEPGGKYEPAGIVHKGEYVIPQEGVNNPRLRPMINMFEMARKNNSLARLDLRPVVQTVSNNGGYASGGYASPASQSSPMTMISSDPEMKAINKSLAEELRLLRINGITAKVNKFGHGGIDESISDINKFNGLTK